MIPCFVAFCLVTTKACPIALARCSSHQLSAFAVSTKHSHQRPEARAVSFIDRKRLPRAPLTYQSCHTRAAAGFTPAAPIPADAWRPSKGGLHAVQYRRQRCMYSDDARSPLSISGSTRSYDGGDDSSSGGAGDLSGAVLESEPLVKRVASALEQRCNVRGGDLVRILGTVFGFVWVGKCTAVVVARFYLSTHILALI